MHFFAEFLTFRGDPWGSGSSASAPKTIGFSPRPPRWSLPWATCGTNIGAHIRFGKIDWNWENNLREKQQLLGKSIVHLIWNCSSNWKIDWTQQKLGEHGIGSHYISTAMIGFAGQLYG